MDGRTEIGYQYRAFFMLDTNETHLSEVASTIVILRHSSRMEPQKKDTEANVKRVLHGQSAQQPGFSYFICNNFTNLFCLEHNIV